MKRSRRVILTMMGTAAAGVVSMGFARGTNCGPGLTAVFGQNGKSYCRAIQGGFGGASRHLSSHSHGGGHMHGGG